MTDNTEKKNIDTHCCEEKFKQQQENLRKVYSEGQNWIVAANTLSYSGVRIFGPISIGSIYLMIIQPEIEHFLALGGIFSWGWTYLLVVHLGKSTTAARETLMKIEDEWKLNDNHKLINSIGILAKHSSLVLQIVTLAYFSLMLAVAIWN